MQAAERQIEGSERILADYVETLQEEIDRLRQEIKAAEDGDFRETLAVRFTLKTQLILDLQRCIGQM